MTSSFDSMLSALELSGLIFLAVCLLVGVEAWWSERRAERAKPAVHLAALRSAVRDPEAYAPQERPAALVEALAQMGAEGGDRSC